MVERDIAEVAERLMAWLAVDSTTGREGAFLEVVERYLVGLGLGVERQEVAEGRWNVWARGAKEPRVWFSTHVDCVPPCLPVRQEGGRVYGRGACDTKGGLLAMGLAAERLMAEGCEDVGFLLVVGEEVDHVGAKLAGGQGRQAGRIILCEPTANRVVSAQKGMVKFELLAQGKAAHSAYPERGFSALDAMLDVLGDLRGHTWPEDALLGPTTFNIGVLEAGVAANVFAPRARAEVLFRAVSPSGALLAEIEGVVAGRVALGGAVYNDPVFFDPPPGVETCTVSFNTDASYLSGLGPVWLVGPGSIECAHGDDEHIDLVELLAGVDRYVWLAREALAG